MRVAIVYDWVYTFGGAERILLILHELFPDAPLFTSIYNEKTASWAKIFKIKTSFLQKFPFALTHHELYPFLTPLAFETFDFSDFDMVISLTSSDAKGIITKPRTLHICYLLTPNRYLWSHEEFYFKNKLLKILGKPVVNYLKKWDQVAKNRPDFIITISKTVQKRIKDYYSRDSQVIYPPVSIKKLKNNRKPRKNYFLVVSRLAPFKRVDLAIKACNKLKAPLIIVGDGRSKFFLKKIAGPTIKFVENLTDYELISYYQNCRALIIPSEEDFGIVALEALILGKPVIAYGKGGVTEIVKDGLTGIFFPEQETNSLIRTIKKFELMKFSEDECYKRGSIFSEDRFKKEFLKTIRGYQRLYFKNLVD